MSSVDMSVDDLIRRNKRSRSDRRDGKSRGSRRRFSDRNLARSPKPYATTNKPFEPPIASWLQAMFVDRALSMETDVRLYISNLDYGVSEGDLKELLSEIGGLKQCCIHHDKSGRSKGTAEVVLSRYSDAISAITRYDNVTLDGKPMRIHIVGANLLIPAANPPPAANVRLGDFNGVPQSWHGRQSIKEQPPMAGSSKGSHGFGRNDKRKRAPREQISAEDLDADLDKYRAQVKRIN